MHTHNVAGQYVNAHLHSVCANLTRAKTRGEMEKPALVKSAPVNPGSYK